MTDNERFRMSCHANKAQTRRGSAASPFLEKYGPWALVAGAAQGIGAEFARQLAARGFDLVLLDIQEEKLVLLSDELGREHDVRVRAMVLDLLAKDLAERISFLLEEIEIGLLVYNAALAPIGSFQDTPLSACLEALDVNCRGPTVLCRLLAPLMAARGHGGIILMSSLSGFCGTAMVSLYAASKAFNRVLAEGLWDELKESGVDVLAVCPGMVDTPGFRQSEPARTGVSGISIADEAFVVGSALHDLGRRPVAVPGIVNKVAAQLLGRLLPRSLSVRLLGSATRSIYPSKPNRRTTHGTKEKV